MSKLLYAIASVCFIVVGIMVMAEGFYGVMQIFVNFECIVTKMIYVVGLGVCSFICLSLFDYCKE